MKTLLLVMLLVPVFPSGQRPAPESPKADASGGLVVVKFDWRRRRKSWGGHSSLPAVNDSASKGGGAAGLPAGPPEARREQPSVEQQSAAMTRARKDADKNRVLFEEITYRYKARVKNTDARTVQAFYWAVETPQSLQPDDVARRQFFCAVKVRPGKTSGVEGESVKAPSSRVSAEVLADGAAGAERVVINRVEYTDGSVWQRPGWTLEGGGPVPLLGGTTQARVRGCIELRATGKK